jgi:regulatory protein
VEAYTQALVWLARRELSERQVRDRLARRGFAEQAVDEAVARLVAERAIDDQRVALAYARSTVRLRGRGRERVRREIEALGIDPDVGRAAVDEVFAEVDEVSLLEHALAKRWPRIGGPDRREQQRMYQALVRQGFPPDRVLQAIRSRRRSLTSDD